VPEAPEVDRDEHRRRQGAVGLADRRPGKFEIVQTGRPATKPGTFTIVVVAPHAAR